MELLTKAIRRHLPALHATQAIPLNKKVVVVKFFTPDSNWTWYAVEFDGKDLFWGLVCGFEQEWGYFSLRELESVKGKMGLPIERDRFFRPTLIRDISEVKVL